MKYLVILSFLIVFFMSSDDAFAVCCFPYDMIHYIDPITGSLVVSGELWNDSYKVEPFGNAKYEFVFYNSTGGALFERELLVTDGHSIRDGFVINPLGAHPLPFQMVIDDVDSQILNQVAHVGTGRTHVDYFSWKPTDLNATLSEFKKIETIQGQTHGTLFDKWQVSGTITNTYSEATQNVYVLASLYESEHRLVGVAGYSNDDIQPKTLDGHETKEFKIHALIPQEKSVKQVSLYAESDNSSMKYPNTKPIVIKPDAQIKHGTKGNSIPISVNVTNISRENIDFDWILQIKKSPKSLDEGDITNYPESKVAFIDVVPIDVMAQESKLLEYLWTPTTGGIYFYEMYMWDDGIPVSPAFAGSFLYSDQILVTSNSLKEQLASGVSFENLQCINNLVLLKKYDGSPVCVKSETKEKLIERGWTTLGKHLDESEFKITGLDKYYHPNEPLSISVVKTGYDMCDDWSAKVIDYSDNSTVWQKEFHTLCIVSEPLEIQNFIYQVTNENNQLIISKSGDYLFQIDIGIAHLEKDIVIRQNMSGVSFDRTTYSAYCNKTFEDNEIVKYSSLGFAPSRMVFFVNQNSTAHICIKYTSNLDNEGTLNLEADQKDGSLSFYNGTASKIQVSVTPSLIPLQNGALTVADYSITIPPDERGVYWLNVSQMCERIPIVTSDYLLSDEDIPAIVGVHGCPMILLDAKLVSYSGVIVQYHDAKPITGR